MKKIFIIVFLLFITGCTAEYRIDFTDETFSEKIVLYSVDGMEYDAIRNGKHAPVPAFIDTPINLEAPVKTEGFEYYDLNARDNNVYLNYKFDIDNYEKSYFSNICYDYFKVFVEDDAIIVATNDKFRGFTFGYDLDKLDVIITTNHDVLYSNADEVNDDEYIWHITKDNVDDAGIKISFSKEAKKTLLGNRNVQIILILVGIVLMIVVLSGIIYIRYKRINKI